MTQGPTEWRPKNPFSLKEVEKTVGKIAPRISFETHWERDPYFVWDGDGEDPALEGYQAYDVSVQVYALVDGVSIDGFAYLGGSYSKPREHDPEIHGYYWQMAIDALRNLIENLPKGERTVRRQANKAIEYLKEISNKRYSIQRREIERGRN